jgi:hypothetical protein
VKDGSVKVTRKQVQLVAASMGKFFFDNSNDYIVICIPVFVSVQKISFICRSFFSRNALLLSSLPSSVLHLQAAIAAAHGD